MSPSTRPPADAPAMGERRTSIIAAVKRPLGFFTLIVLVLDALLAALAVRATGQDFAFLLRSAIVLLFTLVALVFLVTWKKPQAFEGHPSAERPRTYQWDVFLAAPMAACADEESYQRERDSALRVLAALRTHCGYRRIYFAGEHLETLEEFEAADVSLSEDLEALRQSRYFVLLYPEKLVTSALAEAGAALALGIPSIYHVRSHWDLPFLLREAPQADQDGVPRVKVYEFSDVREIEQLYRSNHRNVFGTTTASPAWV